MREKHAKEENQNMGDTEGPIRRGEKGKSYGRNECELSLVSTRLALKEKVMGEKGLFKGLSLCGGILRA